MKTCIKPAIRFRRPVFVIISGLGLLFAAGPLTSCGTSRSTKPVSRPVSLQSSHWFKAKNDPPTYFPKGVPADHPTTYKDGSWVMTGDAAGTRYFIPVRGVDTQALTAEAMSTRTLAERKRIEKRDHADIKLSEAFGKGAEELGYLLLEADGWRDSPLNREGQMRSDGGLWENKERR